MIGPISCVSAFNQKLIIINDTSLAREILEKRSANHSSRPRLVFANELLVFSSSLPPSLYPTSLLDTGDTDDTDGYRVGWEKTLSSQNNTPLFHTYRKIIGRVLGSHKAAAQFNGLQETESRKCLLRLLEQPERFGEHIRTYAIFFFFFSLSNYKDYNLTSLSEVVTAILKMTYGYSASPDGNDPLIKLADRALLEFSQAAMPGFWLVDVIPSCKSCRTISPRSKKMLKTVTSEIHPRMVPRRRIPARRTRVPQDSYGIHQTGVCLYKARNGRGHACTVVYVECARGRRGRGSSAMDQFCIVRWWGRHGTYFPLKK
jgi:hypothetical protein